MFGKENFKYLIIIFLGGLISCYLFYSANQRRITQNNFIINNAITRADLKFNKELGKANIVLESMAFFFKHNDSVSLELFKEFTNPFISGLPGIKALEWAPRVAYDKRLLFEESQQKVMDSTIRISKVDSILGLVLADKKEYYFPIEFANPVKHLKSVIGVDLSSDPRNTYTFALANRTKNIVFSQPIKLLTAEKNDHYGFLVLKAVFGSIENEVVGYVLGVYDMTEYIAKILDTELKILDIVIVDQDENKTPLFTSFNESRTIDIPAALRQKAFKVTNRKWHIQYFAKEKYASFPHTMESYFLLLFGFLITSMLGIIVYKNDSYQHTLEDRVLSRTSELEKSNKEKENLLQEIHHRVKNNLQMTSSLINIQKRKLTNKEAITALEDSQSRIMAIALTHQKIYQDENSKTVDLKDYLSDLMVYQRKLLPTVNYTITCPEISLNLDVAVPIGLILSELVTNALKHAFKISSKDNQLHILVTQEEEADRLITITLKDNGKGLPENFEPTKTKGIGFKIINSLCKQISAELNYTSNAQGTNFILSVKNLDNII
ncbi:CHASE domain-containing protein [Flavobacteriaceae bacterium KMM 6897]|nr:CHASE domain-containing protein [Flavobacteriaceae bacterium KMM 6897]MEB8346080.1 CHASE domain-containing protein [Flavobacteriaceae bacterium KMM 6898]